MSVELLHGDCIEVMRTLPDASVHSCVTDPPYHLTANKKGGTGVASVNLDSPYGRSRIGTGNGAGGFMGQAWDGGDIAFRPDLWREVLRVLKPGGHLLAFSGTRTYHRMACAIEDAGFEIRDQIGWAYGQGFPKSHNLDGDWQGWGTALKPAWEPICLARKPLAEKTVAANVLAYGTGAINVDGCRVETGDNRARMNNARTSGTSFIVQREARFIDPGGSGRWPANLVHDGSDEVVGMFPQSAGQQGYVGPEQGDRASVNCYGDYGARPPTPPRNDSGSAARFFYSAKASRADRNDGLEDFTEKPLLWSPGTQNPGSFQSDGTKKAAKNNHPTVKPTALMQWLCRLVTPPGGTVLDPFMGSGSTGRGALLEGFKFIGIEQSAEYLDIARARIAAIQRRQAEQEDIFA